MIGWWSLAFVSAWLAAASLLGAAPRTAGAEEPAREAGSPRAAHLERGDAVQASYERYRERLTQFFERFGQRLAGEPDLRAKLEAAPPAPVVYGYQILPRLVPRPAPGEPRLTASYGWKRTEGFVERDTKKLDKLEAELAGPDEPDEAARRARWTKMVEEYRALSANQKLIANHIEYNRLWQAEIARDRAGYDRQTALHDAVLEHRAIQAALTLADPALAPTLRARSEALGAEIEEAARRLTLPDFVALEQVGPRRFVFAVPVYTDIEDDEFLDGFRRAVESLWRVSAAEGEFEVKLRLRKVPAAALYPDGAAPARGAHLELDRHIARFPGGGAVLTTGGNSTYVLGRGINVGPPDIHPNIAAHEFGHILGFADGYFRGYRDRGADGFEVLEAVTDPDDIMSAPGEGHVGLRHFQNLVEAARRRS